MEAFFALIVLGGFVAFLALCVAVPMLMGRVSRLQAQVDELEIDLRQVKRTAYQPASQPRPSRPRAAEPETAEPAREIRTPSRPLPAHLTASPQDLPTEPYSPDEKPDDFAEPTDELETEQVAAAEVETDATPDDVVEQADEFGEDETPDEITFSADPDEFDKDRPDDVEAEEPELVDSSPATPPPVPVGVSRAPITTPKYEGQPQREPEPPRRDLFAEFIARIGPDDPDMSWETALGTYWLPRIGALFISVAAVFFLTLAMQQFGPPVRVAVGYAISGAMLGGAWWLEKKYAGFARVLFGAGFSLMYLVTFATYYFPPARIFDHPGITLALLGAIVAVWAGIATVRRSPTIALIAVVLGHTTIGLASFTLDDPGNYSGAGILLLSAGSAYFLLRDKWYYIAAVGLVGSYLNQFLLMTQSESQGLVSEFTIGMGILAAYYFIFALAELFSDKELREHIPSWFRSIFVTVNTACLFGLGSLLVESFEFSQDYHHVFRYAMAVALLAIGVLYLTVRGRDKLYNAYITKGTVLVTLGLSSQFDGAYLTTWLAVQTVVLLVSAQRSGLLITRALAIGLAVITFAHGLGTAVDFQGTSYGADDFAAQLLQNLLTIAAFLVASLIYEKTNWLASAPKQIPMLNSFSAALWQLEFVSENPQGQEAEEDADKRLVAPWCYAVAGGLLALVFVPDFTAEGQRLPAFGIAAIAAFGIGFGLAAKPVATLSLLMTVLALFWGTLEFIDTGTGYGRFALGVIPLIVLGVVSDQKIAGMRKAIEYVQLPPTAFMLHCGAAWLLFLFFAQHHDAPTSFMLIAAAATVYVLAGAAITPLATSVAGVGLLLFADVLWGDFIVSADVANRHPVTFILIALAVAGDRWFAYRKMPVFGSIVYVPGVIIALVYAYHELMQPWFPFAWGCIAILSGIVYSLAFRSPTAVVSGIAVATLASVAQIGNAYETVLPNTPLIAGFLLIAGFWITCERLTAVAAQRFEFGAAASVGGIFVAIATALLTIMLERIPELSELYLTISWGALAFVLLGTALVLRTEYYRHAGMAVAALASATQFYDAYQTTMDTTILVAGFLLLAMFWIACERRLALDSTSVESESALPVGTVYVAAATALITVMLERIPALSEFYLTISWGVFAFMLFGVALVLRADYYRHASIAVASLASVVQLYDAYGTTTATSPLVIGFLLLAGFWITCERRSALAAQGSNLDADQPVNGIYVAIATALIAIMLERIPALSEVYLTISWAVLAFVLFGAAIAMNSAYYRYASLSIFVLASLRVLFVDTRELDPMPRVLAWAGLGLAMMVVGFGYVKFFPSSRIVPGEDES